SKSKTKMKSLFFEESPALSLHTPAPRPAAIRRYTIGASSQRLSVCNLRISHPIPISPIVTRSWRPITRSISGIGQHPDGWTSATDISQARNQQTLSGGRSDQNMNVREWLKRIDDGQNQSRQQPRDTIDTNITLVNAFESLDINRSPKLDSRNRMHSHTYAAQPPQLATAIFDRRYGRGDGRELMGEIPNGSTPAPTNARVDQRTS